MFRLWKKALIKWSGGAGMRIDESLKGSYDVIAINVGGKLKVEHSVIEGVSGEYLSREALNEAVGSASVLVMEMING